MREFFRIVFGVNIVLLVLLGISFTVVRPGTGAFVVAVLSLGVIAVTLAIVGTLLYTDWEGLNW
ncbi:hypothetical protein [Haloprofundus halobius]|uniref:hypothetical protein n=1 Tax=Haloprofundus halobius TaxID=2876194 RepID=UPI001CCA9E10|nr:hypothetical protein [Haloprofundus halobius]